MTKTNNTNPVTNTKPAANVNFRAPIKAHMPINVNFKAPVTVNLTYNGGAAEEKTLEKLSASDLQKYIAERLQGQCETVPEGWPVPIKPVSKSCNIPSSEPDPKRDCDCTNINTPIRDRDVEKKRLVTGKPAAPTDTAYKYDAKKGTGVAEAEIENEIMDEIVRRFSVRRDSLISITRFRSCYDMYAVGTTGDVTYLIWRQKDGNLIIQRQIW